MAAQRACASAPRWTSRKPEKNRQPALAPCHHEKSRKSRRHPAAAFRSDSHPRTAVPSMLAGIRADGMAALPSRRKASGLGERCGSCPQGKLRRITVAGAAQALQWHPSATVPASRLPGRQNGLPGTSNPDIVGRFHTPLWKAPMALQPHHLQCAAKGPGLSARATSASCLPVVLVP